jgi:hypothetical protein
MLVLSVIFLAIVFGLCAFARWLVGAANQHIRENTEDEWSRPPIVIHDANLIALRNLAPEELRR